MESGEGGVVRHQPGAKERLHDSTADLKGHVGSWTVATYSGNSAYKGKSRTESFCPQPQSFENIVLKRDFTCQRTEWQPVVLQSASMCPPPGIHSGPASMSTCIKHVGGHMLAVNTSYEPCPALHTHQGNFDWCCLSFPSCSASDPCSVSISDPRTAGTC